MNQPLDIAIVGGGVIGLTAAYYLSREGLRVGVFDKHALGQEASWAAAGILPPGNPAKAASAIDKLRAVSAAQFPELSRELQERTGIDNGYVRCGGIELEADSGSEWHGDGAESEALSEDAARRLEPGLAAGLGPVRRIPELAQVRSPRHLKALITACESSGNVQLMPHIAGYRLIKAGNRIEAIDTSTGPVRADDFVIAAGAWSNPLLEPLGCRLGIQPVRGQMALLRCPSPPIRHVVLRGECYLVPRDDGRVLAGSTMENVGYDRRTTAAGLRDLLTMACALVPALASAPLEKSWAGLRPGSPDGLPYIGAAAGFDNLFVAAGHFRAGIQLSPGTATLLKEMILGQSLSVPAEAFRLMR